MLWTILSRPPGESLPLGNVGSGAGATPDARAFTESPDTINGLLKQRFRWSFGTLQCLFKHRQALLSRKTPALGFVALPLGSA